MYAIIEIQKTDESTAVLHTVKDTPKEAKAEAYSRAGYAALGTADSTVILCVDTLGNYLIPPIII